ncbi:MAG: 6,7-dimethyl-8-ribityllumazine synthase [Candidatus Eisenbacteria bacterium]|uniref:6,7-dimethyl-8-ribityllumazine synthase n=1 Tax=Eiseniibacteriota bacterium TaxID=2212470 RepID=A0A948S0F2_UNCEI|nr:6,7-dimethyl-8-ribityllumazine synthase [Candidatus Eisenbacteria bacterium]MBU1950392.1 6,7-dimethyl-8-ribityllumazine synthase [Candidatus Eisenbacteria bacterium]MBU2692987.1 6,7-dimethyl-8-ribityllumazine synthase [Candidatus Eisenbacteria bacterium]
MANEFKATLDAKGKKFCIVASRYGRIITDRLVTGALECIQQHGGRETDVDIYWVPGSFEIPLVAKLRAKSGVYDAIMALGCVLRGETPHNEYIAGEVVKGLAHINLETEVPTIFGVLTVDTMEQGIDRAGMKGGGRGYEAASVAIEMANLVPKAGQKPGSRKR